MKKVFIMLAILFMAGCKSPSDLRNNGPYSQFESQQSIDKLSECILYGWQTKSYIDGPMKVFIQPLTGGKSVYTDNYIELADITEYEGVTKVKFYSQGLYHRKEMEKIIKNCI